MELLVSTIEQAFWECLLLTPQQIQIINMESATSYSCFRIYESCCLLRIFNSFLGEKRSVARRESVRFSTTNASILTEKKRTHITCWYSTIWPAAKESSIFNCQIISLSPYFLYNYISEITTFIQAIRIIYRIIERFL